MMTSGEPFQNTHFIVKVNGGDQELLAYLP